MDKLVEGQYEELYHHYPGLERFEKITGGWKIDGFIDIFDENKYNWGPYDVTILVPQLYPSVLPILIETGGKIKKTEDWHNSNGCCLGTEAKLYRELHENITLERWLTIHVVPYLANHAFRVDQGHYANGEFSHHAQGILEYYSQIWGLNAIEDVIKRIRLILGIERQSKNTVCFCGSKKLYKRCYQLHQDEHLMQIPITVYKRDLDQLKAALSNSKL